MINMAKYQFVKADIGKETSTDENANYSVVITIGLKHIEGIRSGEEFSKDIIVTNNNSQDGYAVDTQRQKEIEDYCTLNDILVSE